MASLSSSIMFLLGAGASTYACIPGIGKMSSDFNENIDYLVQDYIETYYPHEKLDDSDIKPTDIGDAYKKIKVTLEKSKRGFNVESLLEALITLEKKEHILFSMLDYSKDFKKYDNYYTHLKNILMKFIRKKCENIGEVNYLYQLYAFKNDDEPIPIFTLNYDGTIEKMCKENNIYYTDGFSEEWNSKTFEEEKYKILLYKLHGSLYWFETDRGKYIKLPIKNVEIENLMYFMDEKISETLIWPMITKDYSTGPFPWLMETFREKLRTSKICYVLGYSFRDDYIKKMILDEMLNNNELWLFIIDHHADEIKRMICMDNPNLRPRIIDLNDDIEEVLLDRTLIEKNQHITTTRDIEEQHKNTLSVSKNIDSNRWGQLFNFYRNIPHLDRIKYLAKYIMDTYQSETEPVPSLQWILFDLFLRFGVESYLEGDYSDSLYWLSKFKECSVALDWIMGRGLSKDIQIVTDNQIPYWIQDKNPEIYANYFGDLNNMIDSLGKCNKLLDDDKDLQKIITNYMIAMELYTKNIQSGDSIRQDGFYELKQKGLVWTELTSRLIFKIKEDSE